MKYLLLSSVCVMAMAAGAQAADNNPKAGDWMIRARAVNVMPDEDSSVSTGATVKVNNNLIPEVDATYFFTPNISAELIAAVTKHKVTTNDGTDVGGAWLLPPTLTLQYHFNQLESVKPYIGAGINYTHFYSEKGGALQDAKYDDSFGAALQAGVDIPLQGNWYANVDVKKLFVSTDVTFSPSGATANVDIDPWLIGAGFGYRF